MEEKKKKLIIIIAAAFITTLVLIIIINIIINTKENNEIKIEETQKDSLIENSTNNEKEIENKNELQNITKITNVLEITKIQSSTKIGNCQINKEGKLEGNCYVEDLKDKTFKQLAPVMSDVDPEKWLALSNDGTIYQIYDQSDYNQSYYQIYKEGKYDDMKYIYGGASSCTYYVSLILEQNGKSTYNEQAFAGQLIQCISSEYLSTAFDVLINKTIKNSEDNTIIKYNNVEIIVNYAVVEIKDNIETIYLISEDNNVYKLIAGKEEVELYGEYSSVEYDNNNNNNNNETLKVIMSDNKELSFLAN